MYAVLCLNDCWSLSCIQRSHLYDAKTNKYGVIPPCGKCREMIAQASKKNQNTEVIISETKKVKLKELLPFAWGGSIEK